MALKTNSIITHKHDKDNTPEYYVAVDEEGKGYLAKREAKKEAKIEEPVKVVKKKVKYKK